MKICNVVGARPQFVKYLPLSKAISKFREHTEDRVEELLIHTGQHYDYMMSKIFFDELGIREPDFHLSVGSGNHGKQTAEVLSRTEEIFLREKPDVAIVYGDTNSTLGAALSAAKLHIPVAHIEAGLRSFNKYMPEEINRIAVDHMSTYLFCPGDASAKQLVKEGFPQPFLGGRLASEAMQYDLPSNVDKNIPLVVNSGDVMFDVMRYAKSIAEKKSSVLEDLNLADSDFGIMTMHRAENTDNNDRFREMVSYVNEVTRGRQIIFPMHPRTKKIYSDADTRFTDNIRIIDPLSYFDMLILLDNSSLVLTDSGGMQKEAFWMQVPCITLRDETEWLETVKSGFNVLFSDYTGTHPVKDGSYVNCYGDGRAAQYIVDIITKVLSSNV